MEKLGQVKAYDEHGKAHLFEVFRTPFGHTVRLDGEQFARTDSHLNAIQAICDKAAALGWHRRAGA